MTRLLPCLLGALLAGCAASTPEPTVAAPVVEVAPAPAASAEPIAKDAPPPPEANAEDDVADEATDLDDEADVEATVSILGTGLGGTGLGLSGSGLGGGGTGIGTIGIGSAGFGHGSGHGRLGRADAPSVQAAPANVKGGLSPEIVRRVVRSKLGRIRFCYERELLDDPTLEGRIAVRFVVGAKGSVRSASVTTGMHPDVDACVRATVESMKFPKPNGGRDVVVVYPFIFSASSDAP